MGKALIFNYHKILIEQITDKDPFSCPCSALLDHLDLIQAKGLEIVSLQDWISGKSIAEKLVILTFDDGNQSDYELVFPILKDRDIPATFFPVLDYINRPDYISWDQLKDLSQHGFEIGSHGVSHQNMRKLKSDDCQLELELSKRLLEKKIGTSVNSFAAPYGLYSNTIFRLAVNAGYKQFLSTQLKFNTDPEAPILHRWNIKNTTTVEELEKILNGSFSFQRQRILSNVKTHVRKQLTTSQLRLLNRILLMFILK